MRLYLDTCSLQRPLDDRSQARISIEAEAVLTVLKAVQVGRLTLLSSAALLFEVKRIPNLQKRRQTFEMLKLAQEFIELNDDIEEQAQTLTQAGIKPMDALHLATAAWSQADIFCSCDDRLLKRGQKQDLDLKLVSPLELVMEITL